jgi:thiol-disulfide isomerase/thioredoxin
MKVSELLHAPLPVKGHMPAFAGATEWLNSKPLSPADLHGKVVLVDFWTFTCINWLRTLPALRAWNDAYAKHGLVVVGVHTPEFQVEHDIANIRRAAAAMRVEYPIVVDNDYDIWDAFANQYWPALYIVDAEGRIRHTHFGEGGEERSEHVIRRLLTDAGAKDLPDSPVPFTPEGIEIPGDYRDLRSPETYLGLARATGFASPGGAAFNESHSYTIPPKLDLNEWALDGTWSIGREEAVTKDANGRIAYRFHGRDLNLILVPPASGASARVRVTLDGEPPHDAHGLDIDEKGDGLVTEARLHQLIRQPGSIIDRTFEIEFLDPGVAALCFTFG